LLISFYFRGCETLEMSSTVFNAGTAFFCFLFSFPFPLGVL
jgi:hypothetical protein